LLFFVLRMINNMRNASKETWRPVLRPVGEMAALQAGAGSGTMAAPQLTSGIPAVTAALTAKNEASSAPEPQPEEEVVLQINSRIQHSTASEDEQRARVVARLTEENPATVAEIIQIWLNEAKKG